MPPSAQTNRCKGYPMEYLPLILAPVTFLSTIACIYLNEAGRKSWSDVFALIIGASLTMLVVFTPSLNEYIYHFSGLVGLIVAGALDFVLFGALPLMLGGIIGWNISRHYALAAAKARYPEKKR